MRTKKLSIDEATSVNNGILFYSKRHKDYVAIAIIDEQGNITTEWTTMKMYKKQKSKSEKITEMKENFNFVISRLPFISVFSIFLDYAIRKDLMYGLRTFLIGFSLLLLGSFIVLTSRKQKRKNLYKFHSAEHMVLNAYRKLDRVPSLEEIYNYSRFSNSCGTNSTTQIVVSFILMFGCTFIPNPLYMILGIISVNVIVLILLQCGFLNFLQKFNTITPTDKELAVAIAGLNVWFENEKKEKEKSKFLKLLHRLFPRVFH